jgi:hypothetical protein
MYRERGAGGRFEIAAGDYDPALGRELTRLGFFQSGFHAALIGEPELPASAPSETSVEPVMSGADMEEFLEAYVRGWGIPDTAREPFKGPFMVRRIRLVSLRRSGRWQTGRRGHSVRPCRT